MSITEQRYRDNSGQRFLLNGKLRCHALSKSQIRKYREEFEDEETLTEDLWPECQCTQPAVEGAFTCRWHGGTAKAKIRPTNILDILPVDLAEKFRILAENPAYFSRQEDILLLKARIWELSEQLNEVVGGEEAWGMVYEALLSIKKDKIFEATRLLEAALDNTRRGEEVWNEIRRTENVIDKLTATEVKTAKELRLMASVEQVSHLMLGIERLIKEGATFIDDGPKRNEFISYCAEQLRQLTNVGGQSAIRQLEATSTASGAGS